MQGCIALYRNTCNKDAHQLILILNIKKAKSSFKLTSTVKTSLSKHQLRTLSFMLFCIQQQLVHVFTRIVINKNFFKIRY